MKKDTTPSGRGHDEKDGDVGKLIEGAFGRPHINEGSTSTGDSKTATAIKEGVGETGEKVVGIIKDL